MRCAKLSVAKMFIIKTLVFLFVAGAVSVPLEDDDDHHMHPTPDEEPINRATIDPAELTAAFWQTKAKAAVRRQREQVVNTNRAKNVIFFLGDGMSVSTVSAARAYFGQLQGKTGEEAELSFDKFPVSGLSKTYCVNRQVADSACSATAYLTGVKANYATIGVTAKVTLGSCTLMNDTNEHVDSILKRAMDKNKSAGIVTTTRVTHASPAGAYAHTAHRDWESDSYIRSLGHDINKCRDIAYQLIHNNPGKDFKVILGGGRREFLPNTTLDEERYRGYRTDGRNLINEWISGKTSAGKSNAYVWNKSQLNNVNYNNTEYLLGLFEGSHCEYNLEGDKNTEPTFTEMVDSAIKILSKNTNGYVLFAEGGRIDHAHHSTYSRIAVDETVEFSKGIERAVQMTSRDDTLIIVTADHSHVMTYSGYPSRGNSILAANDRSSGSDRIPYTTLSYANGPGYRREVNGVRVDVTKENMQNIKFRYPAMVPLDSETHSGEDVPVYATGPYQHLFTGTYEQSTIPHFIDFAACLVDDYSACTV